MRRITSGEGKWRKRFRKVAGIEASAVRFRGGGGVPAVGVPEGGKKVVRKLLRIDVVLVVSLVRARRGRSVGTMVRPSGGGGQDCRRGFLVV
jgi:hypothetical protein